MSITLNGSTGITTPDIDSAAAPDLDGSNITGVLKPALAGVTSIDASSVETLKTAGLGGGTEIVAVSGASQTLDLDAGNFFNCGTTTADTTLSFSNVPTAAVWEYSFKQAVVSGLYDMATMSSKIGESPATPGPSCRGLTFKPDGTKMYLADGQGTDQVHMYTLSTPWLVSSATLTNTSNITSSNNFARGIAFKPDGTRMYISTSENNGTGSFREYSLSTAWDTSTTTYVRNKTSLGGVAQGIFFKPDGLKVFSCNDGTNHVVEYALSTAWDISSVSQTRTMSTETGSEPESALQDIIFKPDGTKMYILGDLYNAVYTYDLSTAWDLSTATKDETRLVGIYSKFPSEGSPDGIAFDSTGENLYLMGSETRKVIQVTLGTVATLTFPSSVQNPPTNPVTVDKTATYRFLTADSGTNVTLIGEEIW